MKQRGTGRETRMGVRRTGAMRRQNKIKNQEKHGNGPLTLLPVGPAMIERNRKKVARKELGCSLCETVAGDALVSISSR